MVTQTQISPRRDIFHAIADPNRRAIIELLSRENLTLNGVAQHFSVSRPAISKHIRVLNECGLVTIEQRGRERYCEIKMEKLSEVVGWVERYKKIWEERFDALELYLQQLQAKEG
jgi:DNA-binding transcriptional ArsR family regulator